MPASVNLLEYAKAGIMSGITEYPNHFLVRVFIQIYKKGVESAPWFFLVLVLIMLFLTGSI